MDLRLLWICSIVPLLCSGVIHSPTSDPTVQPTDPSDSGSGLTAIEELGWSPSGPLGHCQGDCDGDSDCESGFTCYNDQVPPGCYGSPSHWAYDFCGDPNWDDTSAMSTTEDHHFMTTEEWQFHTTMDEENTTSVWNYTFKEPPSTATLTTHSDNEGVHSISNDGGTSWTDIGTEGNWPTAFSYDLTGVSADTKIRVSVSDVGVIGGFIATVLFDGEQYSTTNPLQDGHWKLVSASDGDTSLIYKEKTSSPWGISTAEIASDAFWVWNQGIYNTLVFEFDFDSVFNPADLSLKNERGVQCQSNYNLGTFANSVLCAAVALEAAECDTTDGVEIMWDDYYSVYESNWGCRCCKANAVYSNHSIWTLMSYDFNTNTSAMSTTEDDHFMTTEEWQFHTTMDEENTTSVWNYTFKGWLDCGSSENGSVSEYEAAYWGFHGSSASGNDVTFTNCDSDFDTEMYLWEAYGLEVQNQSTNHCDGDNCWDSAYCTNIARETFTMQSGTLSSSDIYVLLLLPHDGRDGGQYAVNVHCDNAPVFTTTDGDDGFMTTVDDGFMTSADDGFNGGELKHVHWNPNETLSECEGDCDHDGECESGLQCYHDGTPPGCWGTPIQWMDYCYDPDKGSNFTSTNSTNTSSPTSQPTFEPTDSSDSGSGLTAIEELGWSPSGPLGHCQGDCDGDSDCESGFTCYNDQVPPGCYGSPSHSTYDFCGDPNWDDSMLMTSEDHHLMTSEELQFHTTMDEANTTSWSSNSSWSSWVNAVREDVAGRDWQSVISFDFKDIVAVLLMLLLLSQLILCLRCLCRRTGTVYCCQRTKKKGKKRYRRVIEDEMPSEWDSGCDAAQPMNQ